MYFSMTDGAGKKDIEHCLSKFLQGVAHATTHSWSDKVSPMTIYNFKKVERYLPTQKEKEKHICKQPQ